MFAKKESVPKSSLSFEEIEEIIKKDDQDGLKAAFELDGFDVNITNKYGRTGLHVAAAFDKVEIIEILTSHPQININARDEHGNLMTPLMEAAGKGNSRSVKIFIEKGADVSHCDRLMGRNALVFASENRKLECVEILMRSKKYTILNSRFGLKGIVEVAKKLIIESPDDPYYLNTFGGAILHYGCRKGLLDAVKFIVEKDVFDINTIIQGDNIPLHVAVTYSSLDVADYLIEKGASLTVKGFFGQSVYDEAATYDYSQTFLMKYEPEEEFLENMLKILITTNPLRKTLRVYTAKCITNQYPNGPDILKRIASLATEKGKSKSLQIIIPKISDKDFILQLAKDALIAKKFNAFEPLYERYLELKSAEEQAGLTISSLANLIKAPLCIRLRNLNQEVCLICRDDFATDYCAIILPCMHVFHNDCLSEWIKRKRNCPYCQRSIYA